MNAYKRPPSEERICKFSGLYELQRKKESSKSLKFDETSAFIIVFFILEIAILIELVLYVIKTKLNNKIGK